MSSPALPVAAPRLWRHPAIAAVIGLTVLVLSAMPVFSNRILAFDHRAAYALNSAIGRSPVLDHLILALSDEGADERLLALIIIGFIVYCWRAHTRRKRASRTSLLLFLIVSTFVALLTQELLDETIRRRSPAYEMMPFTNIEKIYHDEVEMRQSESFPSEHGMFYFFVAFVLLRLGKYIGGSMFLAAGLVLPLASCAVGAEWVSDIYLGALPVSFLLSALAVETPVFRAKRFAEQQLLMAFDKLSIVTRGKRHFFDGSVFYGTRDIFRIDAAIKRYLHDFAGVFADGKQFSSLRIEMPLAGVRSIIRFVSMDERKIVLRVYPLGQRREAELHRDASEILAAHSINAPRLLKYTDEPKRYGVVFLAEDFVAGVCLRAEDLTQLHLRNLAKQLALLHSVHSKQWGPLRDPREGTHFPAVIKRIDRLITQATQEDESLHRSTLLQWFQAWEPEFAKVEYYSLTHNKLHPENCMYTVDSDYYFLDFTTLEWAIPAKDVVKVRNLICSGDADRIAIFESNYYEMMNADDCELIRRFIPFYEALFHLTAAATQTKRMSRNVPSAESHFAIKHENAVSELKRLISADTDTHS